jgi:hypothetical protein
MAKTNPTPQPTQAPVSPELAAFQQNLRKHYAGEGQSSAQNAAFGTGIGGGTETSDQTWSKYDQGVNVTKFDDYGYATQEKRAREQPLSEKLMAGLSKAGANAAVAGVGAIAAPIDWGVAAFSSKYDLSNAPIGSALAKWNEDVAANNPNFYSQKEIDAPALSADNLFTSNFVTDKLLSGVGFLAGAAAGAWATGGLGELAAAKTAGGLAKGLGMAAELVGGERALGRGLAKLALSSENHVAGLENLAAAIRSGDAAAAKASLNTMVGSIKVQTRAQQAFSMAASTHGEAIMEAMGSYNEVKQQLVQQKLSEKQQHRSELARQLIEQQADLTPQELEARLTAAGLGQDAIANLTDDETMDVEAVAGRARQAVYLGNVAVLSLSNAAQLRTIMSRGYGDLLREEGTGLYKAILGADGKYALNAPKWWQRAGYSAIKSAPSEMAEEGSQTLMQKTALAASGDLMSDIEHRRSDLGHQVNEHAAQAVRDEVLGTYNTYRTMARQLGPTLGRELHDKEFQESVFLGGLIGVLGDGGHQAFSKVTGNGQSARQKNQALLAVDFLNQYGRNGSLADDSRSTIRHLSNEMDVDRSVKSKSAALYDEARNNQLRGMVVAAKKAGRLDDLRQSIDNWQKIAESEDKEGKTPDGEVPLSAEGMKQMRQTVDELDALYDQTSIAYGRAFKGGSANVDAAFEHVAATHLRNKSFEQLAQRVATNTQTAATGDGFDLKGFFAGRDPRATVLPEDISTAATEFAKQRQLSVGDPVVLNLKADLAHAAQLRRANSQSNTDLLALQEGTLGNRLNVLQAQMQRRPALTPQYMQVLRERQGTAAPADTTAAADEEGAAEGSPTPAAEDESPAAATPDLAGARAAALASVNINKSSNNVAPEEAWRSDVIPQGNMRFSGATLQEVTAQINEHFDQLEAEQTTQAAGQVRAQAQAGQTTGDDSSPVSGDTSRVGGIAETGQDADAYYATVSEATADSFGNLSDEATASGVVGLPVVSSPVTFALPLGTAEGQLSPTMVHFLNDGTASIVMSARAAVVPENGTASYEFVLRYSDGTFGPRFEVPLETLNEAPGAAALLAAHEALQDGQLPEEFRDGIPVRTHALIDIGTVEQNNQRVQGNRLPQSQQYLLFDPNHAVVVRVSAQPGGNTAAVLWGSQSAEREVATSALTTSPNVAAGDYLVHSVLRQDGAPAVFPLSYSTATDRMAASLQQMDNQPAGAAIAYIGIALHDTAGLKESRYDGQSVFIGESEFAFDENGWNNGERDLDKLLTPRQPAPAATGAGPQAGVQDNEALAQLAAQVGGTTATEERQPSFTDALRDAVRQLPAQTPEEQTERVLNASVQWNPQNSTAGVRVLEPTAAVLAQLPAPLNEPDERDASGTINAEPITPDGMTLDEARAEVERILPAGVTVGELEAVHARFAKGGLPIGAMLGHSIRLLSGRASTKRTAWHESYHVAQRYLFSENEQNAVMGYARKNAPKATEEDLARMRKSHSFLAAMDDEYVADYLLEEWLADHFADYMQEREKGAVKQNFLTRFWAKLANLLGLATTPQVHALFEALGRGDLRSRELAPLYSEPGAPLAVGDIAYSYVPEAGSVRAQESATQVLLAYFINAKHSRLAVRESVVPGGRPRTFFLPGLKQLTDDFAANTADAAQGKDLTDQQLLEAVFQRRKQEDTVALPEGLEGDALQQWLDANQLYLPDRAQEWRLSGKPAPVGRAYRQLYESATAKQSLMGELLKRERGMRAGQLTGESAAEDAQATEQSERNYDAGMLEGGAHLPARLGLYLSTIIYREEQEPGGPLVTRSVDANAVMRRLRTIANVAVLPKSVEQHGVRGKYAVGSLADFVQKIRDVAAQGQGTKEGAMLSAVAARLAHDFGYAEQVSDLEKRGEHAKLANLRLVYNEANQRRMPAIIAQLQNDGTFKILSAQRRPLWTEVMSTARQIWGALSQRDRREAGKAAADAVKGMRSRIAQWTREYNDSVAGGNQKNAKLVNRTTLLREVQKLRSSFNNLGLVLPEEFYLAALTGNDTAYEVKVAEKAGLRAQPLPGIVTTEVRDDDGNLVPSKTAQKMYFKEPLETARVRRNDLLDELERLAGAVAADPEADIFTDAFLPKDENEEEAAQAQRKVRLSTRNMAQQAADYDAAAMENMWLDADGKKQRSYAPGSYLTESAWQLENGLLPSAVMPLPFLRSEYDTQYGDGYRQKVKSQQEAVLGSLGQMGEWLKSNWLVRNHLQGTASIGSLRYFYDGGVYVKQETGQLGQTTTQLSERDTLLAHLGRFQGGLVTMGVLEAAKLSMLIQHSEHTGDTPWVFWDSKKNRLVLDDPETDYTKNQGHQGLELVQQQVSGMVTHMKLVLDELYGDEVTGKPALAPWARVDNVHGKLPTDGRPISLPYKALDAEGNPRVAKLDGELNPVDAEEDENGNPVELTRAELEKILLSTNNYSALPRGLQPLDLPILQNGQVSDPEWVRPADDVTQQEQAPKVPLTLGLLLRNPTSLAETLKDLSFGDVMLEREMLREIVENNLNEQYDSLRRRMANEGINESHLAPLRGLSGVQDTGARDFVRTTKERNVQKNRTAYSGTEEFLGDFLMKSQLFRDGYGHLTRGHEANFGNATSITKRGKGMSGFGPHAGEGRATIAVIPTIEEVLDRRTMQPAAEDIPEEFVVRADGTDAQGYITLRRLKEYLSKWWNLNELELDMVDRACRGVSLSEKENEHLYEMLHEASAGPIKNMFYGLVRRGEAGMANPLYIKTSVLPLIPAFTSQRIEMPDGSERFVARPGLEWYHDLRNRMESHATDEVYHTTAVKLGGSQLSSENHTEDLRPQYINNRDMRRQQVVPAGKQEIISGSQLLALLDGNISDAAEVLVGGVTTTVAQLRAAYTKLHADTRAWQLARARGLAGTVLDGDNLLWKLVRDQQRQMGMDEGTLDYMAQESGRLVFNPNLPVVEGTLLSSMLNFLGKQSLRYKTQGGKYTLASAAGMKLYERLDPAGNVVGVQNPFEARPVEEFDQSGHWQPAAVLHPNGAPQFGQARPLKMHQPRMSQDEKLVTMGEARGYPLLQGLVALLGQDATPLAQQVADQGMLQALLRELDLNPTQVSAAGLAQALEAGVPRPNGKMGAPTTFTTQQLAVLAGVLAKLPAEPVNVGRQVESVDYAECIISGDFLLQHGLQPEDLMDPTKISADAREDLLKMLGYRIPTQAHQSMIPLKVVGVSPAVMGSTIFCPSGMTFIAGWDFDIDSLFTKRPALWKDQTGQLQAYGQADTPQQQEAEYRQAVKGDKFYKAVLRPALLEVRQNLTGVWNMLKSAKTTVRGSNGAVVQAALPDTVVTYLDQAIKVGGIENLRQLRTEARDMRTRIDEAYGSFARVNELAGIQNLQDRGQKNKAAALTRKFAERLYPDLAPEQALTQYEAESRALAGRIAADTYSVEQDNGSSVERPYTAGFLIDVLQQHTELLRTALEADAAAVEDKQTSDDAPLKGGASTLDKVLAHYLALHSLGLPMTAWQAAREGTDSQQAQGNRLLKTELALLTAPALWPQLSMATSPEELVAMSKDMREFLNIGGGSDVAYNSEGTLLDQRTATYEGRDNIGFSAYMNAALSHAAKLGLRIKNGAMQMGDRALSTFAVHNENDLTYTIERKDGRMDRIKLGDGRQRLKAQSMTDHMSMDTDNAKHMAADALNFNAFTTPHIMLLEGLGYGEKRTGFFMEQPVIRAMAEYRARQENSIARSLDDPRDFGQRLGDLEILMQELVLERTKKAGRVSNDQLYRRKAALEAVDFLAPFTGKHGKGPAMPTYKNGRTVNDFNDKIIVESLNRRNFGEAVMGALLSSRLPALVGQALPATAEVANLLEAYGIEDEADIKALYAYLIQQRAFFEHFEKINDVVQDVYSLATVTSLVKGDISSEQDLMKALRVIERVDGTPDREGQGLKTLSTATGGDFSFNTNALTSQLVKTVKFVHGHAEKTFLRFMPDFRYVLDPILSTLDVAGDKPALRELLTAEALTVVAARSAVESGWLAPEEQERGRELITHPTENIVTKRAELLAAHPELASNALLRKMEEVLPGKNGATYWGLRANLVGVGSEELEMLRDSLAALALHSDPQVREFAIDLKAYVRYADGPTASSQSLAQVLSADAQAAFSEALNEFTGNGDMFNFLEHNAQDIRERIFSNPQVRAQVPARQQLLGAVGYLSELAYQQVADNPSAIPADVLETLVEDLRYGAQLAENRGTKVMTMSSDILQIGLRQASPEVAALLDDALELLGRKVDGKPFYQAQKETFRQERRALEEQLQAAVNDALQLTGERDRVPNVSIIAPKERRYSGMMGIGITASDGHGALRLKLSWQLPAAVRLAAAQDAPAQNDAADTQQAGDADESSLRSMRFAVARTTPLAVNLSRHNASYFVHNNLSIDSKLPQQPGRRFADWAGELASRERDLAAVGEQMNKSGRAFMERIGDTEAGVATVQNDDAMLEILMQGRTPGEQHQLEIAASVLLRVYGQDLGHLPYPAQLAAVQAQMEGRGEIHCEL